MTGLAAGYSWLVLKRLFALRLAAAAYLVSMKEPGRSAILWILLPPIQLCTAHPLRNGNLASRLVLFLMFACPVIVWRACQAQLNCVYCDLTWCCVCVTQFQWPTARSLCSSLKLGFSGVQRGANIAPINYGFIKQRGWALFRRTCLCNAMPLVKHKKKCSFKIAVQFYLVSCHALTLSLTPNEFLNVFQAHCSTSSGIIVECCWAPVRFMGSLQRISLHINAEIVFLQMNS